MKRITRREVWGTVAAGVGCLTVAGAPGKAAQDETPGRPLAPACPWPYHRLDADLTAEKAYHAFQKGHCMYGVFAGIVGQLAERHGQPYASFPLDMMDYGMGGVMGYGSLCGALNGAAAAISLFVPEMEKKGLFVHELFAWYEQTPLPLYSPGAQQALSVKQAKAESVLCHVSAAKWCKAAGLPFDSIDRRERCRRLTAETARRTVELLNVWLDGKSVVVNKPTKQTEDCLACHGPASHSRSSFGTMNCAACHEHATGTHPPETK